MNAISDVISRGEFVLGSQGALFEMELASFMGVSHVISCGNGTDALQLALRAIGVRAGDSVITAANAGGYTTAALGLIGALPIYADVDSRSALLTVETLQASLNSALTAKPKALVVTHLYGAAADMPLICSWARENGLMVVEDCAQSLGARIGGVHVGNFGVVSTTSFYPTKNLGGIGDGGAVITNDSSIKDEVVSLRQYGWKAKYYVHNRFGTNSRLDEIQATVLRLRLARLDENINLRRGIHTIYEDAISPKMRLINKSGPSFAPHLAVVQVPNRVKAIEFFSQRGIDTGIHYPVPDHKQSLYGSTSVPSLPVTEKLSEEVLSVPLFAELASEEIARVSDALSSFALDD